MHYLVTLIYFLAFILIVVNIWQILIKQEKVKTLPLLFFYEFAFIAITTRQYCLLFNCLDISFTYVMEVIQPLAKFCAGLFQAWMIFEITVQIRFLNNQQSY